MSHQLTFADTFTEGHRSPPADSDVQLSPGDLIIFPTSILSEKYRRALIFQHVPHNPDQITTLSEFCRNYHANRGTMTRVISDGQAYLLLATTLERIKSDIPFFFNQGRPSSGTIKDLLDLRKIVSQRSIDFVSHPLVSSSEKCRQIFRALAKYQEALTDNRLLDSSALIEWTIQDLTVQTGPLFDNVRIHRLYELFPRERSLLQVIRDHATTFRYEYLKGKDPAIFSPPDWITLEELVELQPKAEDENRSDLFTGTPGPDTDALIHSRIFTSTTQELESIAEEICALGKTGIFLEDIAITFPNIAPVLPVLREVLLDFGIPFHAYVGEPLIREPVIGFLLLFPSLVADVYPRKSVIELLKSPYFNISQPDLPPISVALFDLVASTAGIEGGRSWEEPLMSFMDLVNEGGEYSNLKIPKESVDAVITWITEIQNDCNRLTGNLTPAGHSKVLLQLYRRWMRPEFLARNAGNSDTIFSREVLAFQKFQGCLTRLSSMVAPKETIDLSRFLRFLTYILQEPVYLSEDRGGVRVLGLRQTVGMDFSCLFLGGLIEGEIPNPSTRMPLLTSSESEQLGGRTLQEVVREERYYFVSALSAGKRIWLSASKTCEERSILSSSFFERVKEKQTTEWGREITRSKRRAAIRAGKNIRNKKDDCRNDDTDILTWLPADQIAGSVVTRILIEDWYRTGTPDSVYDGILKQDSEVTGWLSDPSMFGPDRIWSATQLETYVHCPFRFFLERVIRLTPFPDVDPTLSPAQKGVLIHDTLYAFYSQWCANGPRRITSRDLSEAASLLQQIGTGMSERYRFQSPVWHATVASLLGFEDGFGLYKRFIDHEAECEGNLVPDTFEYSLGTKTTVPGKDAGYVVLDNGQGEPVRLRGRIDRIDTTTDGYFAVIDYKTGSTYPTNKDIREGKALQLPLYLLAIETMHKGDAEPKIGIGGSYIEISRKIKQSWPLLDSEKKIVGHPGSRGTRDFRDVVRGALATAQCNICAIRNGLFPLPLDDCKSVRYCPYSGICRLDLFRLESEEKGGEPDDGN